MSNRKISKKQVIGFVYFLCTRDFDWAAHENKK